MKLDGVVLAVEGIGKTDAGTDMEKVVHHAFAVLYYDQTSGTYSYLLADQATREAVLIDAVYEQYERDLALIRELELRLLACLETHCHADHVTGAWLLKHTLGCQILASQHSGIELLERNLKDMGVDAPLFLMKSSGGASK